MSLSYLEVRNLRILEAVNLDPHPQFNLLVGANASGKTSVLEAVHILANGRSFRSTQLESVRRRGEDELLVHGRVDDPGQGQRRLGFQRTGESRRLVVDGVDVANAAALAEVLPVQTIAPDTHFGFLQEAKHRRGLLDWGLFHVEPEFYPIWRRYQRALSQRNSVLKSGRAKELPAWDQELVQSGEAIQALRQAYLQQLEARFETLAVELVEEGGVGLDFSSGWDLQSGLQEVLSAQRDLDLSRGFTQSGPHRADLRLRFMGQAARSVASHGQQKMLVLALRLAQLSVFTARTGRSPVLLIDDLAAELDIQHRARLLALLGQERCQVFVTATEADLIDLSAISAGSMFHVEHGQVRAA